MKTLFSIFLLILTSSCTLSITLISTNGKAKDVVDSDQDADAHLSATIPVIP